MTLVMQIIGAIGMILTVIMTAKLFLPDRRRAESWESWGAAVMRAERELIERERIQPEWRYLYPCDLDWLEANGADAQWITRIREARVNA